MFAFIFHFYANVQLFMLAFFFTIHVQLRVPVFRFFMFSSIFISIFDAPETTFSNNILCLLFPSPKQ